jgi:hypothetical protein
MQHLIDTLAASAAKHQGATLGFQGKERSFNGQAAKFTNLVSISHC